MGKTDIRVRFTKKMIQESLIELMKTQSILNIPIKAICAKSGVSRSTFYTYYEDQYDLLHQIEEETLLDFDNIMQKHSAQAQKSRKPVISAGLQELLQYVADNCNSIQVLMSENGDSNFHKKFIRNAIDGARKVKASSVVKTHDEGSDYSLVFLVGGGIMLVQEWLKNGMDTPVPDLAKIIARLIRQGLG